MGLTEGEPEPEPVPEPVPVPEPDGRGPVPVAPGEVELLPDGVDSPPSRRRHCCRLVSCGGPPAVVFVQYCRVQFSLMSYVVKIEGPCFPFVSNAFLMYCAV